MTLGRQSKRNSGQPGRFIFAKTRPNAHFRRFTRIRPETPPALAIRGREGLILDTALDHLPFQMDSPTITPKPPAKLIPGLALPNLSAGAPAPLTFTTANRATNGQFTPAPSVPGTEQPQKKRIGRRKGIIQRPLSPQQWRIARAQYEAGGRELTCAKIAAIFNTSPSTVTHRCAEEKWRKGQVIIESAKKELQVATEAAMKIAAQDVAQKLARDLTQELQPWIEKEKRSQIKRAIKRSKAAHRRIDAVSQGYKIIDPKSGEVLDISPTPKDEGCLASAEEKYDGIIRRNLGMDDANAPTPGKISLRMLAGPVAIEVQAG